MDTHVTHLDRLVGADYDRLQCGGAYVPLRTRFVPAYSDTRPTCNGCAAIFDAGQERVRAGQERVRAEYERHVAFYAARSRSASRSPRR